MRTFAPFDPATLTNRFEELESEVVEKLTAAGYNESEIELERFANLSYGKQVHEISVPVPRGLLSEPDLNSIIDRFETKYADLYGEGAGASETGFELETIRVDGFGPLTKPRLKVSREPGDTFPFSN